MQARIDPGALAGGPSVTPLTMGLEESQEKPGFVKLLTFSVKSSLILRRSKLSELLINGDQPRPPNLAYLGR